MSLNTTDLTQPEAELPAPDRSALLRGARQGLTLVEIMVVMAILGVLMAVLGGSLLGYLDSANVDATKLTIGKMDQALQVYAAKHRGKYPSTSEGLEAAAKYMPDGKVPQDAWGQDFQYFSPSTHSDAPYDILSVGKDGQEGSEDDVKSWEVDEG
jgi:general secretion pathway protein G